jgi:hypothetical protein
LEKIEKALEKLEYLSKIDSDINEHLYCLNKYAGECDHVTEMGTRYIVSTWAFLAARPKKIVCYDFLEGLNMDTFNQNMQEIKNCASSNNVEFIFTQANVLEVEIEETDLLFIDTYHEYNQLKQELHLHSDKVRKYLIFHDTTTFGDNGETFKEQNTLGIWPAIQNFLDSKKEWSLLERFTHNNGLTILKKDGKY